VQYLLDIAQSREPDFVIGDPAAPYLRRWWVVPRNDVFNVYLHQLLRSDDDRALHDHPWDNTSVILKGRYIEVLPNGDRPTRREGYVVHRQAAELHRLVLPDYLTECWSLFITGPWLRSWGFQCGERWVHWKDFVGANTGEIGKGCAQ
jgi:hypothetical protein